MPALPADIVRATRAARVVTLADSAIKTAFPNARDVGDRPQPGYFEDAADAATCLALTQALIGAFRRRFVVAATDEVTLDPLDGVPAVHVVDAETEADTDCLMTRIEVDLEGETTTIEAMG